jgi:membrane fusion protein (multidrug efflux system)
LAAVDQAQSDILAAEANIRSLDAQISQQQATIEQARADVASAESDLTFAQQEYARYATLAKTGAGNVQRAQQAATDLRSTRHPVDDHRADRYRRLCRRELQGDADRPDVSRRGGRYYRRRVPRRASPRHPGQRCAGSGQVFALLPPENATGNFTKIVQRVPVKILIDPTTDPVLDRIRAGLSVEATVDTRTAPPEGRETLVPSPGGAS